MRAPVLLLSCLLAASPSAAAEVELTSRPEQPWIERSESGQLLNFDLIVANRSSAALELVELEIVVRDRGGALVLRRALDTNGVRPSIGSIVVRDVAAGESMLVFNPFHTFPADFPLSTLELTAKLQATDKTIHEARIELHPRSRAGAVRLPVAGRLLHHDGHDFLAHHRRFDYLFPPIHELGFNANVMRYAYDFVPVDGAGRMSRGDEADNSSWFGFGVDVSAAADGEVVAATGARPDDRNFDMAELAKDVTVLFGNFVVIRHADGVFSLSAHLKQGSVLVKPGDRVRAGQKIGQIGASGGVSLPHLHFQLQACADARCEGLPVEFDRFHRIRGAKSIGVKQGPIDTGELVERD